MKQQQTQRVGMTRRDVMRRGAVIGGTLMWAAPAVQTIAKPAFAAGSEITGFSYFAATVQCSDGVTYRVKYEVDDAAWECPAGSSLPACEGMAPSGYDSAEPACGDQAPLNITISQSGNLVTFTLHATDPTCTFSFDGGVHGVVKEANNCAAGTVSADGQSITFDTSVTDP